MAGIFISYRREDAAGHAGRLCDRLGARFGDDRVFMDLQDIQPGEDFVRSIDDTIGHCDVVLAVIGPRWLDALDERAGVPEDFVRREIGAALARGVPVIPVLVGGAGMPPAGALPADLAELSRRQAIELRTGTFDDDAARIALALEAMPAIAEYVPRARRRQIPRAAWLIASLLIVAGAAAFVTTRPGPPPLEGVWLAEMRDAQERPFQIRLRFVQTGGQIGGTVEYPTGQAAIHDAVLQGRELSFATTHVPQFESEPATLYFQGEVEQDAIRLTLTSNGGVATGTAMRAEQ